MSKETIEIIRAEAPNTRFEPNAVIFTKPQSLEQLNKLAAGVSKLEGATAWWLGDIGLAIQDAKRAEFKAANKKDKLITADDWNAAADAYAREYTTGRADSIGVDDGYWWNCVLLCRFFPSSQRCEGLSVHHHRVALIGAGGAKGDPRQAKKWLETAREHGWSASELRRHVNLSLATHTPATAEPEINRWKFMDEADREAVKTKDLEVPREAAVSLLTRFKAIVEFIDRLKLIAKGESAP